MPAKAQPRVRTEIWAPKLKMEMRDGKPYYTFTPYTGEEAKQEKWGPVYCAGYDTDEQGKKHYHHLERIPCHCIPGPQYRALFNPTFENAFEVALLGGRGSSKGQPFDAKIATPSGWTTMGDVQVGTQLLNPDGTLASVIKIVPLGVRKIFEVTCSDGGKTRVTDDHLWLARLTNRTLKADRRYEPFEEEDKIEGKIYTTEWLKDYIERERGKACPSHVLIPLPLPLNYRANRWRQWENVDPYVLGFLLGNGCLRGGMVRFVAPDAESVDELKKRTGLDVGADARGTDDPVIQFYFRSELGMPALRDELNKLGVYGKLSHEKFIPLSFLYAPIGVRWEVLRGLMDTDGCADEQGHLSFTSSSKQLALDLQQLIWSLGGKATLSEGPSHYLKDGERVECRTSYRLYIQAPNTCEYFHLARKKVRCIAEFNGGVSEVQRRIVSIEYVGEAEARCIAVDHPNQLYITDDFIVTHNTEVTFGFLARGNLIPAGSEKTDISYINNKNYSFLVLRKNAKDLKSYKRRAAHFFGILGGVMTEDGVQFPSGAWGIFDHLADADAWEKYQGQEFTRIVVEEANQIPDLEDYMKVLMSCRTPDPHMKEQMLLTLNPGGRGHRWSAERFYKQRKANGKVIRDGEVFVDPTIDDFRHARRVYIRSTVEDNPYFMAKGYDKQLDLLKTARPTLWKRWRHGDMDVADNQFFEEFRAKLLTDGGVPLEAPNACHVCKPRQLLPHWPRALSLDWGYSHKSAAVWTCWTPQKQLHVYRELGVSKVGTVELGARLAEASFGDLRGLPGHHMTLYLSPDAFARTDEGLSEAEGIAQGIAMILGENAAFVLSPNEAEDILEDKEAWTSVYRRQRQSLDKTNITIVRADNARKAGWARIHEYLRWWSIVPDNQKYDEEVGRRILMTEGARSWHEYKSQCDEKAAETLPVLQIWETCTNVIDGIQSAEANERDTEDVLKQDGDDFIDSVRYNTSGFTFREAMVPREIHVAEHVKMLKESMPGLSAQSLIMAAQFAERQHGRHARTGVNISRFAARRAALTNAALTGRVH